MDGNTYQNHDILTCLLLFVSGEFLNRAAVTEASDGIGQPFPERISRAFGSWRVGLQ